MAQKYRKWKKSRSKLRKKLSVILPKEVKAKVQNAVLRGAMLIKNDAQAIAPKDEGDLAEAIKVQHRGDKMGAKIGYFEKGNKRNWKKAGWRAHFTEFGTRGGTARNGQRLTEKPAQPFLGPAYKKRHKQVVKIISSSVNRALTTVSRGNF